MAGTPSLVSPDGEADPLPPQQVALLRPGTGPGGNSSEKSDKTGPPRALSVMEARDGPYLKVTDFSEEV